ncbi:NAD(P)H-dependent oxidoreductase [Echinicola jeungdonensis]|uniref:NADPH-dependent FMN reductase n=1 Tax=Echinicola jeungdonensis TaxID=709343 RepID=A0ABV5J3K2_9BACT|nr:NAD(P)H-dependent oxidoreductase [Echinicola jeungdonensis]MDN3668224.1 NAD(P)H-dependent oxidoreductase [Echinicola jeungdonensis]
MKKIIAFGGSNSSTSINKQLAQYAAGLVAEVKLEVLDLNDFELPLYSEDLEGKIGGQPENAHQILKIFQEADGFVLSLAEHNGGYSAVLKNLFDWISRIDVGFFNKKPILVMATSPGSRGGETVLDHAKIQLPRHSANIVATFSLPSFYDNFSDTQIVDEKLDKKLKREIEIFEGSLKDIKQYEPVEK